MQFEVGRDVGATRGCCARRAGKGAIAGGGSGVCPVHELHRAGWAAVVALVQGLEDLQASEDPETAIEPAVARGCAEMAAEHQRAIRSAGEGDPVVARHVVALLHGQTAELGPVPGADLGYGRRGGFTAAGPEAPEFFEVFEHGLSIDHAPSSRVEPPNVKRAPQGEWHGQRASEPGKGKGRPRGDGPCVAKRQDRSVRLR